ncbi:hypothetical protein [Castellaniella sp.]|uniref:hypothetical protein n=1 Tax=Castellaniella sp. TaxID=1955812 RepID=UPI003C734B51
MTHHAAPPYSPDWTSAPPDWDWAAQDADGRWFWYRTEPAPGIGGGVWRANSRNQQYAGPGAPNPDWLDSLQQRPAGADKA